MRFWLALVAAACACRARTQPLSPAGSDKDDGHGLLARASAQFLTDETVAPSRGYGGNAYGGGAYGGALYGGFVVPSWPVTAPDRAPKYNQVASLTGAIEGTVVLRAGKPLACGTPRIALVYIERVQIGRALMSDTRPLGVGGTLVKRGCGLAPAIQIVTPLPAAIAIHGDGKPTTLTIGARSYELQAGGRVAVQLPAGTTRVTTDAGASAFVVALDTPYYALTDAAGRYRLDELAPGAYQLTIWQPPVTATAEPTISKRTVRVESRGTTRVDIR